MDAKYLAEIKARHERALNGRETDISEFIGIDGEALLAEVERLTARLQESPYGDDKIDELEEACDNLRFQAESKDQQIATLKKALELACEEISDYALPSGTGRMKSVLITARIEKFMNHAKRVQEQEERMIHHE